MDVSAVHSPFPIFNSTTGDKGHFDIDTSEDTHKKSKKKRKNTRDVDGSADDTSPFPIFNFITLQPYWGH